MLKMATAGEAIRVLHVDDQPDFAEMAAIFLERVDDRFEVETVESASEALDRLDEDTFDCVVSDYEMPKMDGIEFLNAVRERYPDLPFVLFTGKGSEEIASDAISAGVTDYLQKESGTDQYAILANRIENSVERARAKLEKQRHLDAIETAREGISILDDDGVYMYVNRAYADLFGYEPEELVGEHWEIIHRESDVQRMQNEILPIVEEDGHWHGESIGLRADGSTFIEDQTLALTEDGELICTVRDITGEKERERRFEAIFNNTYTFVGLMDPDGTLVEANETALTFGGLDRDDVVGKPLWETYWFQSNDDARTVAREAVERAREGDLYRNEIQFQGSDEDAVIDFSVRPIFDERGTVSMLVPEGRDVSERNQYIRRLETLIDNLPGMVYRCANNPGWPMENVRGEVVALTGYEPSEIENRNGIFGDEIIHPDDQADVWDDVQAGLDTDGSFEITYRIVTKDGTVKRVWERGQGVYSPDGELEALEGFITAFAERPSTTP